MFCLHHRAFSLMELLGVLVIAFILMGLIWPYIDDARQEAAAVTCASNLHQISQATANFKIDHRHRPLRSSSWPGQLNDYLGSQSKVYTCPADDNPDRVSPPMAAIDIFCPWCEPPGKYLHTMMFQEGPVALMGGTARPKDGAIMGNPPVELGNGRRKYELWFEDIPKAMNPDYDFDDFVVEVMELPHNRLKIHARKGNAGFKFNVVDGNGDLMFSNVNSTVKFELTGSSSSYGMNREVDGLSSTLYGQPLVQLLDYQKIQAVVNDDWVMRDDWDTWLDKAGQLPFARHRGKCNVLYLQGNVARLNPARLDPEISANLRQWLPGHVE